MDCYLSDTPLFEVTPLMTFVKSPEAERHFKVKKVLCDTIIHACIIGDFNQLDQSIICESV